MVSARLIFSGLALACAATMTGCGGGSTTRKSAPTATAKPQKPHGGVSGAAGKFVGMAVDKKTGWWLIPQGTDMAGSYVPLQLGPAGKSVTFQIAFKPAGSHPGVNGFGLKFFTDAPPGGTHVANGYTAILERTGFGDRFSIYRQVAGAYIEIIDTRINGIVKEDGRWHTLKVIVSHANGNLINFTGYVDKALAVTAHDSTSLYSSGVWGPTNLSSHSNAYVDPKSFSAIQGSAQPVPSFQKPKKPVPAKTPARR